MLTHPSWRDRFPGLSTLSPAVSGVLDARAQSASVPRGTVIFGPGHGAENLVLLSSGTVRVQRASDDGRDIVLYRVHAGESCGLTSACLMAFEASSAHGIAETPIEAVLIPRDAFDDLMGRCAAFRAFVFAAYSRRVTDMFAVIEETAFGRMDMRVAHKLIALRDTDGMVHLTHRQLAAELCTGQDVVSGQLRSFAQRGWLGLDRGGIELRDSAALERLACSLWPRASGPRTQPVAAGPA